MRQSAVVSAAIHPPPHSLLIVFIVIGQDVEFYSQAGFDMDKIHLKRNAPVSLLYEDAIRNEGAIISGSGSLINFSGKKTGRSPKDKRIVYEETSKDDIWWGSVNIKMDERMFFLFRRCPNHPNCSDRHLRDQPRTCHRLPQHKGERVRFRWLRRCTYSISVHLGYNVSDGAL